MGIQPEHRSSVRIERWPIDTSLLPGSFWTNSDTSDRVLTIPTLLIARPICPVHGEPVQK